MSENKSELMFVKLFSQKAPEFKEVRNKDWVYFGDKNQYPDYLIDLYERSSTHAAIINGKRRYVLGEGWAAEKKGTTVEARAKVNDFIERVNPEQSLNELSAQNDLDFELYDGFYIEVIMNRAKTNFDLHYMPFNKIRTDNEESAFYYSEDWSKTQQSEEKTGLKEIPKFDFDKEMKDQPEKSLFYFRILSPRKSGQPNVYPVPGYVAGTQSMETEAECSNFNLSEIKSNFSAGTLINFYNGVPTIEEQKKIKKQIINELTGTDAAGQMILNFADSRDNGSEVLALNGNDLAERYLNVRNAAMKTIFTSHGVSSPSLFGVQQENVTFGSRLEIAEQYEIFQNTYISGRQQILEGVYNKFASYKGVPAKLKIRPTAAIQANVFTEAAILSALPKAAIRDRVAEQLGVDLTKYENATVTEQVKTKMESEDLEGRILEEFSKIGRSKDQFNIIRSKPFTFTTDKELMESELMVFQEEIDEDDPALRIPKPPTKKEEKDLRSGKIEIRYSYELRKDAPALKGESRNFCRTLISLNKLYTRREIDGLSNGMGTNVWLYKGGWYNNPNTDAPTPQCRHIWMQHIVKVK